MTSRRTAGRFQLIVLTMCSAAVALVLAGGAAAAGPAGHAALTCKAPKYPGSGYFTSLTVEGTGCSTGQKLALAYYRCRTKSGPRGRCKKPVLGFRCRETRNSIPTEINARVSCKSGAKRVVHTYQQNL
jgi:hypothetical protein